MSSLGAELYALTLRAASGTRTVGELAGHSQVAIWRNWPQTGPSDLSVIHHGPRPGNALPVVSAGIPAVGPAWFDGYPNGVRSGRPATSRVGLVRPTSLCRCGDREERAIFWPRGTTRGQTETLL